MQRKLKLLGAVLICALVISTAAAVSATWVDNSIVKLTSSTATDTFTTTVVGVDTNAVNTPIDINGVYYTSSNIATFAPPVQSGDPNNPSTVSISASGFIPADYALFKVTITNTGSATLAFGNYQVLSEFVDSSGNSIAYTFPLVTDTTQPTGSQNMGGNTAPANPALAYNGPISGFWDTSATQSDMTSTFKTYINNEAIAGCANTWCGDNALIGSTTPTVGMTLAHGATFTYYIYLGLGVDTAYGIPSALYTVTIPLTAAQ
jgi:hypothetical protein